MDLKPVSNDLEIVAGILDRCHRHFAAMVDSISRSRLDAAENTLREAEAACDGAGLELRELGERAPSGTGTALGRLLPPAREANDLQRRILVASGKAISMKKSGEIYLYDEAYKELEAVVATYNFKINQLQSTGQDIQSLR